MANSKSSSCSQRSPHKIAHTRSCILHLWKVTLRLDGFNLLQQGLILTIDLDVAHLLQGDLLGALLEEFEPLGTLLAHRSFETVQLGLVDLPRALDVLVEAEFVADGNGSEHSAKSKIYRMNYHPATISKKRIDYCIYCMLIRN